MKIEFQYPELIVEIANSHDGNPETVFKLVDEVNNLNYPEKSLKFQIFAPDTIALEDFQWFEVYKEITFDENFWADCLNTSYGKIKNIWIDIFDSFGVDIFKKNKQYVSGLKLQASVLENYEVRDLLGEINLNDTRLLINVSGFEIEKIKQVVSDFSELGCNEIILQIGFQSYPTKIEDTGIQKISKLLSSFENKICLADHVDASLEEALDVPIYGIASGASMIEKHICLDRKNTRYDYYSALEPDQFNVLIKKIDGYMQATNGHFISPSESEYLEKSIQVPVLKNKIIKGSLISLADLKFRRTSQLGLSFSEISNFQKNSMILSRDLEKNNSVAGSDFRGAKIGVIIAGRLKSSRLKRKALLPLKGKPTIQWCYENCRKITSAHEVILATSDLPEDTELVERFKDKKNIKLFRGHPVDVISRYLGACSTYEIDIVIRVTADCPFISYEIAELLLKSHFENGADYTAARDFSVGTSCEIINSSALKTVSEHFGQAEFSEYMTWYFQNNTEFFKINMIDLPTNLLRNYRLTLDYEEDLKMFEAMLGKIKDKPINIESIFQTLDAYPEISEINAKKALIYKEDVELIDKLNKATKIKL